MIELSTFPLTSKEVTKHSARPPLMSRVTEYLKNGWPTKIEEQFKPYYRGSSELCINLSCLQWGNRVAILFELRKDIPEELHDNHPRIVLMKMLACSYFWWPSFNKIIKNVQNRVTQNN